MYETPILYTPDEVRDVTLVGLYPELCDLGLTGQQARRIIRHERKHAYADVGPGQFFLYEETKPNGDIVGTAEYQSIGERTPAQHLAIAIAPHGLSHGDINVMTYCAIQMGDTGRPYLDAATNLIMYEPGALMVDVPHPITQEPFTIFQDISR